jgi:Peptidase A4 family
LDAQPILWFVNVARRTAVLTASVVAVLAPGSPAEASTRTATSSNWAGYSVSRSGVTFKRVSGTWVQPKASCDSGRRRYSAYWLGLGGLHTYSKALEQVGTEADCAGGKAFYSAWYELVPDDPVALKMTVRPGDTLSASVTVTGHTVKLYLANRTRGTVFTTQLQAAQLDVTSAEWIAEAPSVCDGSGCDTLPLADFGTATFAKAQATSTNGHAGTINDPAWSPLAISLSSDHRGRGGSGFVTDGFGTVSATPAELNPTGDAFAVTYERGNGTATTAPPVATTRQP